MARFLRTFPPTHYGTEVVHRLSLPSGSIAAMASFVRTPSPPNRSQPTAPTTPPPAPALAGSPSPACLEVAVFSMDAANKDTKLSPDAFADGPVDAGVVPYGFDELPSNCSESVVAEDLDCAVIGLRGVLKCEFVFREARALTLSVGFANVVRQLDELLNDLRRLHRTVLVAAQRLLQRQLTVLCGYRERKGHHLEGPSPKPRLDWQTCSNGDSL